MTHRTQERWHTGPRRGDTQDPGEVAAGAGSNSSEWGTGDCKDPVGAQDIPAPCWSDASCCLARGGRDGESSSLNIPLSRAGSLAPGSPQ